MKKPLSPLPMPLRSF